ncbi:MAG: DUF4097 family beta strand repeat-containing protein [Acidobacteriales bacterium]|nr:DUF4097 family beta strand repeat-containing protein [Terriglobales bacterium]
MSNSILTSFLPATMLVLAGCGIEELDGFASSQRFKEDFHYTYNLSPGGRISVDNTNGSVEVIGWEKDSVDVSGTKYASTESLLKDLKVDIAASPTEVRIRTLHPSGRRGGFGAKYVLRVPQKAILDHIESTNGSLRAESVEGPARLHTTNGSVRVLKLRGEIDAQTSNGSIEATDTEGAATAHTTNGSVTVDGLRGSLDAGTTNGRIRARIVQTDPGKILRASTTNGAIELTMESFKDNDVRASTTNGSITVRLPSSLNARLRAGTTNSSVTTDFDVTIKGGTQSKKRLDGNVGSGGPLIDLSSTNGTIKILKLQ